MNKKKLIIIDDELGLVKKMTKRKGFYFAVNFPIGKKAGFMFLPSTMKPFKIDAIEGTVMPKGIPIFNKKLSYFFAKEWNWFENKKIKDIHEDKELREWIEELMEGWCKKHHRKYHPIFKSPESPDMQSLRSALAKRGKERRWDR